MLPHFYYLLRRDFSPQHRFYNTTFPEISPPATLPPTYRAVSPPPPVYQATPKAYLTVQDLYMRYAPLKSIHSAPKLAPKIASYLTVQDLCERFEQSSKKPHSGTAKWTPVSSVNRTAAFGPKQLPKSAPLVSKASIKSIGKNTGKAVHSNPKPLYSPIEPSAIKPAFGSKVSSMESSWASYSNTKTLFPLRQKLSAQASTIRSLYYMRSPKHTPMIARIRLANETLAQLSTLSTNVLAIQLVKFTPAQPAV